MTEQRGLHLDAKSMKIALVIWQVWIEFNYHNEPANCITQVWVPKTCPMLAKPKNPFIF